MGVFLSQGSVVDFSGDCIVNAANEGGLRGGGVDGAVTAAGGQALARAPLGWKIAPYPTYPAPYPTSYDHRMYIVRPTL